MKLLILTKRHSLLDYFAILEPSMDAPDAGSSSDISSFL